MSQIDERRKIFLDEVWRVYGKFDSHYLEMLTHNEEPWIQARKGLDDTERSSNEISTDLMKDYYFKKASAKNL